MKQYWAQNFCAWTEGWYEFGINTVCFVISVFILKLWSCFRTKLIFYWRVGVRLHLVWKKFIAHHAYWIIIFSYISACSRFPGVQIILISWNFTKKDLLVYLIIFNNTKRYLWIICPLYLILVFVLCLQFIFIFCL